MPEEMKLLIIDFFLKTHLYFRSLHQRLKGQHLVILDHEH